MEKYNHKTIEKKWQAIWEAAGMYRALEDSPKPKQYVLDMFPYPSGEGLHLGHTENYTATCIYSRYLRMKRFNVFHPIGWDAFGLPSENYAIKTGVHPDVSTHQNIKNFITQIKSLGFSVDFTREIDTSSPEYYKWTQWFFLLLYKNGLAYKKKAKSNWCESCKTVLANEQAEGGICERCKNEVVQKDLEQWFFKITDFAEDLINDLNDVDWPSSSITAQRNWIGKSEGAIIKFKIKNEELKTTDQNSKFIEVFTTRPDTLFGVTYIVVAPELIDGGEWGMKNEEEVREYLVQVKRRTDLERTADDKEKTGVLLKGIKAINPSNQEEIPIFVADYVLGHYGTGAVMAVPAHDERDFQFAKKHNLPIKMVVCPNYPKTICPVLDSAYLGKGNLVMSGEFNGVSNEDAKEKITDFVKGRWVTKYKLRDWLVSRQRYWGAPIPIIYCETDGEVPVPEKDLPVKLPTDVDFLPTGESPLKYSKSFNDVLCPLCGKKARREADTMDTFVCSSWYYLRYVDPRNSKEFASKENLKKWLPVDMYMGGAEHIVLHLMYARFFAKVLKKFNYIEFNEPFKKLRHQGMVLASDGRKMSKSLGNVVNPNEIIGKYGADTLRLHIMFLGPLEDMKSWNDESIAGPRRFLERVWRLCEKVSDNNDEGRIEQILHKTIKKVGEDIEVFSLNTAISALMMLVNEMEKSEMITKNSYETILLLLSPFVPHITEELWHKIGNKQSIHLASWPVFDHNKIITGEVTIAVQVNGKVRDTVIVSLDNNNEDMVFGLVSTRPNVARWTLGKKIKKVIFVPGKILNIVV
ncbi:MAG: leucine--tRNA ligase [Candidatus Yonathbacteria bacterium]|nr:leucine--tRNA ligase [Candidatus Yonathbacteria bacterium]